MSTDKKKAALGGRDRKRREGIRFDENTTSTRQHCSIEDVKIQGISSFLPSGKKNAVNSTDLMELLNIPSKRELRHIIARARENGEIILSDSNGYYLPAHGEEGLKEIVDCVRVLRAKGISTLKAAAAIKKPLNDIYGQQVIEALGDSGQPGDGILSLFLLTGKDSGHDW